MMWSLLDIRTGRIGRRDFVILTVLLSAAYKMHFLFASQLYNAVTSDKALNPFFFVLVCSLPFLYMHALVQTRRLRDCGITVWAALIGLAGQVFLDGLFIYVSLSRADGLSKWQIKRALEGLGLEPLVFLLGGLGLIYYFVLVFKRSISEPFAKTIPSRADAGVKPKNGSPVTLTETQEFKGRS